MVPRTRIFAGIGWGMRDRMGTGRSDREDDLGGESRCLALGSGANSNPFFAPQGGFVGGGGEGGAEDGERGRRGAWRIVEARATVG